MNELTMYQAEELSAKQYYQFVRFARETQTYLPFKEVALVRLTSIAAAFCLAASQSGGTEGEIARTKQLIGEFAYKYYPYGFKTYDKLLSTQQYHDLARFIYPRFYGTGNTIVPYEPIEKIVVIRLWRSCYRFITNMEQIDGFITELILTANLIRK